ncbi:MAG TPA: AMP-binding protein [Isosphaeraceae bacterium]|jgi:acyl-[acyl-carrier-protein]-phospholipid O-acyltransferase/long-chain-fatty-acid--[acyl-carrier-protein] ligase|nr:AMP-binding protein [Isosphaeraceae bacterium]
MSPENAPVAAGVDELEAESPLPPLPAHWRSLQRAFVHRARAKRKATAVADSTGAALSYGDTFLRALALGRVLARRVGDDRYVGLMVPPSVPAAVANLALVLRGKVPVNLNYTAGQAAIDSAVAQCGIRHVVTARKVLERFPVTFRADVLHLEDVPPMVKAADKLWAAAVSGLVPIAALGAFLPGLRGDALDDTATVIFTSGSTGDPKGVVLSNRNILSNVHQIDTHVELKPDDVVLGILPFFHSFGFTVPLWAVLTLGLTGVYHVNPLDARIVGHLCEKHGVTIVLATPTFFRAYIQRCGPEQFSKLRLPILGAEKLKPELAAEIRQKLEVEPLEGYGCTETGPVVAVNVPHDLTTRGGRTIPGNRPGTVGLPLPGTAIQITDPENGAVLPRGAEGIIHVKGPQVMVGYLGRPEATAAVVRDGWYDTGDLGTLDADGFLSIGDRLSRFSKIGGEMVPHRAVESALFAATGADEQALAVTALPDPRRGERLVVVHTGLGMPPEQVYQRLAAGGLPRLWLPSADQFVQVEALPVLGTGKLDLRGLRQLAERRLGEPRRESAPSP